jgi:hypothetical protein
MEEDGDELRFAGWGLKRQTRTHNKATAPRGGRFFVT